MSQDDSGYQNIENLSPEERAQLAEELKSALEQNMLNDPRYKAWPKSKIAALAAKLVKRFFTNTKDLTSLIDYPDEPSKPDDVPDMDYAKSIIDVFSRGSASEIPPRGSSSDPDFTPAGLSPVIPDSVVPGVTNELPVLPCGFYLMYSATAAGKSLSAAALACAYARTPRGFPPMPDAASALWDTAYLKFAFETAQARKAGQPVDDIPIWPGYLYMYEARAWQSFFSMPSGGAAQGSGDWSGPMRFVNRLQYALEVLPDSDACYSNLQSQITPDKAWMSARLLPWYRTLRQTGAPQVLVLDSVTLPMRAYCSDVIYANGSPTRSGEPTMPQGLQPSDIAFCVRMQQVAVRSHLAIIGIVNSDLVPFADKLEAVCEGAVEVDGPGVMRIRSRRDRSFQRVDLTKYRELAAAFLNYVNPKFDGTIPGVVGF